MMYLDWASDRYPAALLLHFDGNFSDSSANNHPVTSVSANRTSTAKFGTEAYSGSLTGYLTIPDSDALELGLREWSVDWWIYVSSSATLGTVNSVLSKWTVLPNRLQWIFGISPGRQLSYITGTGSSFSQNNVYGATIPVDQWVHCAIYLKKSFDALGGTVSWATYFSVNGSTTLGPGGLGPPGGGVETNAPVVVGGTDYFDGMLSSGIYVDELRLVIGDRLVDFPAGNFTPPTGPYG